MDDRIVRIMTGGSSFDKQSHTQVVFSNQSWVCSCGDTSEDMMHYRNKVIEMLTPAELKMIKFETKETPNLRTENNAPSVADFPPLSGRVFPPVQGSPGIGSLKGLTKD